MRTLAKRPQDSTGELSRTPIFDTSRSSPTSPAPGARRGGAFEHPSLPNLSRRSVVTGMVAAAAATLPQAAQAAVTTPVLGAGGDGTGPDARLVELGRRYRHLASLEASANETYERCCAAVPEQKRPDVLRHRMEDHVCGLHLPLIVPPGCSRGLSCDPNRNAFYTAEEISRLRFAPPPSDPDSIADQQARVREIELAWRTWLDQCWAEDEAAGVHAAEEAVVSVVKAQREVVKEIAATPATTLVGLQVRAEILAEILDYEPAEEVTAEEQMTRALLRDLLAMVA